jgi:hypothetical protein
LNGGLIDDGLVDLTGLVAEKMNIQKQADTVEKQEQLWRKLMDYKSEMSLLGCSIDGANVEGEVRDEDGNSTGLLARHAYALIDVLYIPNPSHPKKRNRLLRVRNPWGNKEWSGKWSDHSDELTKNLSIVMKEVNKLGPDEQFTPGDSTDGTFLM